MFFSNSTPWLENNVTAPGGVFEQSPPESISYEDDVMDLDMPYFPTDSPTVPFYKANEYEIDVPDFAEHDDFFEAKPVSQFYLFRR